MNKKTLALLLLVLILFAACACANNNIANNTYNNTDNNIEINNQPPFSCELDREQAELVLTYLDGRTVRFSMTDKMFLGGWDNWEYDFVAHGLSWAAYGDTSAVFIPASVMLPERDSVLEISRDAGETWQEMTVPADQYDITKSVIGFTSQDKIWLLLEGGLALTKASLRLYKSEDGGNTWMHEEIGEPVNGRQLDYIDFLSTDEGYLAVGAGIFGPAPLLYKTVDGGETWVECTVETRVKDDSFGINDICYNGDVLTMSGHLVRAGGKVTLTSEDGLAWLQQ